MGTNGKRIVVAGATGQLGKLIVKNLLERGAFVIALSRESSEQSLESHPNLQLIRVDYRDSSSLEKACSGVGCVVSALSGLRDVIVDAQVQLLAAAVRAGVKRFIPSDYCIDYRPLKPGSNRNLDLRREFSLVLDKANVKATSVLNGMFSDLLNGDAPVVLFNQKRIFFWGPADQKMDFTTRANTAEYTAAAAMDDHSPRWLKIAGDVCSMRDIQHIASEVSGEQFKLLRPGGLGAFKVVIKVTKAIAPGSDEPFPAWQGMQYLHDMLSGHAKLGKLDNDRYPEIEWTTIADVLAEKEMASAQ